MGDVELIITKVFNASPEEVFAAWTDPVQLAQWYGPEGFTNTIHEFDLREGGTYRLTMHGPKGEDHPLRGTFRAIEKPKRLVMTWQWEGEGGMGGGETVVTVELRAIGQKTEMTMTHAGFADEKEKTMHNQGWSSSFNKLEKVLA